MFDLGRQVTSVLDVDELLQMMRAKRRLFSYGSAGVGNTAHLAGELFKHLTRVEMEHVPYRGLGPATLDLLAKTVRKILAEPAFAARMQDLGGAVPTDANTPTSIAAHLERESADFLKIVRAVKVKVD